MSNDTIHVGDVGVTLRATLVDPNDVVINLSTTTSKTIVLRKPNGSLLTKTAGFTTDGTDGQIEYVTIAGDLDGSGEWRIQGHVAFVTGDFHSDVEIFTVLGNLV